MNSRRKFIFNSALTAGSFILPGPLKSFAFESASRKSHYGKISIFDITSLSNNAAALPLNGENRYALNKMIRSLKQQNCHSLLLGSGNIIDTGSKEREEHIRHLCELKSMNVDAIVPGHSDLAKGTTYYDDLIEECNIQPLRSPEG